MTPVRNWLLAACLAVLLTASGCVTNTPDDTADDQPAAAADDAASEPTHWSGTVQEPGGERSANATWSPLTWEVDRVGEEFTLTWNFSIATKYSTCTRVKDHSFTGTGTREVLADYLSSIDTRGTLTIQHSGCDSKTETREVSNLITESEGVFSSSVFVVWQISF